MAPRKQISVVKTAQMANTQKLIIDGAVVGSVVEVSGGTVELRDHRDRLMGTYGDVATAIADFEKMIGFEEIKLDF
ncbi:hypothetical protein [Aliiruegeria lutimaris]|uniref:Uncharacterized protein n=1 Tax=Aliiruegeria lutimaris TaxID=571298 RepID=A0A1G8IJV4_9RHOB|nr:hypothetical protein [Aliiruegeria lutimaris]SDI19067.1 hypothetical protein SAMN04488026_100154 [Aliiruegeria lutimaris]